MKEYLTGKNVRIRCRKDYPEAHTHIMVGRVREETPNYIVVEGKTFHYRRLNEATRSSAHAGDVMQRAIPWSNIEIIHELGSYVDYTADFTFDKNGNLVLKDEAKTVIALLREGRE